MPDDGDLARRDVELGQEPTTAGDDPDVARVYRERARRDTLRGAQLRLPLYAGMAGLNSRHEPLSLGGITVGTGPLPVPVLTVS